MDLHSKMTMYISSKMTSPVTKTAKTSKWLRLKAEGLIIFTTNFNVTDVIIKKNLKIIKSCEFSHAIAVHAEQWSRCGCESENFKQPNGCL